MIQIAIDAMGGDFAPEEIVLGGIQAAREFHISVVLVGDKEQIEPILRRENAEHDPLISVHHASQVIEMDEHPGLAFRKKRMLQFQWQPVWCAPENAVPWWHLVQLVLL